MTQAITVKIENAYSDGHVSTSEVVIEAPDDLGLLGDLSEWFEDKVYEHTGDGHGAEFPELGSCYTAEIIAADNPGLLGVSEEWTD